MRVLVITTMRNEAPFILEWIAYHRHIGVTDFLIYTNDCDDGTDLLLDRLDDIGIITHERNHSKGKKPVQWRALAKAWRHPLTATADWIYGADVDEFLNIHAGDGKITDLIAAEPDANGFALPWRMFGNAGIVSFEDQPITSQFTKAAPDPLMWPWRAVQSKSLFRNDGRYEKLGVHSPHWADGVDGGLWVDGAGRNVSRQPAAYRKSTTPRYKLAQINHYALGATESFLVKAARGKPNHMQDPIDLGYWVDRNLCDVTDTSILRHQAAIQDGVADLMRDARLRELHQAGVAWRRAKISEILATFDGFTLFTQLQQTGPTVVQPLPDQARLVSKLIATRQQMTPKAG